MGKFDKKAVGFTPKNLAQALKKRPQESAEEDSKPQPVKPQKSNVKVQVHLGGVVEALVQAARFVGSYRLYRRQEFEQKLDRGVLALAARFQGLVGLPDLLMAELCNAEEGVASFQRLLTRGHCHWLCDLDDEPLYLFPAFSVKAWVCRHCDSHFPESGAPKTPSDARTCPGCGAQLELILS